MAVVKGGSAATGNLDANGNWVWTATVTPDQSIVTPAASGTPVDVELGFTSTSTGTATVAGVTQGQLKSVVNANAAVFDTATAGSTIFGWEIPYTPAGGTSKPEGVEVNCTGCTVTSATTFPTTTPHPTTLVAGTANQIFAALGSANITAVGPQNMLNITVQRPVVSLASPNTTTNIQVSGAYGTAPLKGRIAQLNGATSTNYDTFGGTSYSFTRNAHGGDTDLNGAVNFADFQLNLLPNLNTSGKTWQTGDFDGNGNVNFGDFQILLVNLNTTYTVGPTTPGAGAGLGAGGAVPEPASIAMLGLALLGGMGMIRRKR